MYRQRSLVFIALLVSIFQPQPRAEIPVGGGLKHLGSAARFSIGNSWRRSSPQLLFLVPHTPDVVRSQDFHRHSVFDTPICEIKCLHWDGWRLADLYSSGSLLELTIVSLFFSLLSFQFPYRLSNMQGVRFSRVPFRY